MLGAVTGQGWSGGPVRGTRHSPCRGRPSSGEKDGKATQPVLATMLQPQHGTFQSRLQDNSLRTTQLCLYSYVHHKARQKSLSDHRSTF